MISTESFKINYTDVNHFKIIKVDNPGLVSFSAYSTLLTASSTINIYESNYNDYNRKVAYPTLPNITSYNVAHQESLNSVNSIYIIIEVNFGTSTAGDISFSLAWQPEQSFFLPNKQVDINTPKDFYTEVAKGNIYKHSLVHKFGSGDVGTTLVPISNVLVYKTPTTATSLEVVSSSAADAQNGIGARSIIIIGLDANWSEITQTVSTHATNGTTAVAIPTAMTRLYRWYVSTSGSYATETTGSHQGTLTIRVAGGGTTWSTIPITPFPMGQSQIGCYSIPIGYTARILSKNIFTDSTKTADIYFFQRPRINDVTTPYEAMRIIQREVGVGTAINFIPIAPKGEFVGPCDIGFMGKVLLGTAQISVEFELLLIQD